MSISDLLNSSGAGATFKFTQPGASVSGTITAADVVQKKNFDTGEPEFWSDGKPIQQIRVTLATDLRDPTNPEDDGARNVYIKGWGDQLRELRRALQAAGASDLLPGGTFTATYTSDGELAPGKRGFPPKVYAYAYVAPSATAGVIQQPAQQVAQAAPAPQQAATFQQPTPPQAPPAAPAALPDGLNLTPEQLAAIQAMQAQAQQG